MGHFQSKQLKVESQGAGRQENVKDEEVSSDLCSICYEDFNFKTTLPDCGHSFCFLCIKGKFFGLLATLSLPVSQCYCKPSLLLLKAVFSNLRCRIKGRVVSSLPKSCPAVPFREAKLLQFRSRTTRFIFLYEVNQTL